MPPTDSSNLTCYYVVLPTPLCRRTILLTQTRLGPFIDLKQQSYGPDSDTIVDVRHKSSPCTYHARWRIIFCPRKARRKLHLYIITLIWKCANVGCNASICNQWNRDLWLSELCLHWRGNNCNYHYSMYVFFIHASRFLCWHFFFIYFISVGTRSLHCKPPPACALAKNALFGHAVCTAKVACEDNPSDKKQQTNERRLLDMLQNFKVRLGLAYLVRCYKNEQLILSHFLNKWSKTPSYSSILCL